MNDALNQMFHTAPPEAILRLAEIGHLCPFAELRTPEEVQQYNTVLKIFSEGGVVLRFGVMDAEQGDQE